MKKVEAVLYKADIECKIYGSGILLVTEQISGN